MCRTNKFHSMVKGMSKVLASQDKPFTVKMRTGVKLDKNIAHTLIEYCRDNGVSAVTVCLEFAGGRQLEILLVYL